ncbi:MAG TPA: MFS transporter, partial [Baekduia sp.]|nr:MFS transporter [Baekduia sp.]
RNAASPLLPAALLRRRRALAADAIVLLAAGALLAMFFFLTLYLQRVLGLTALQTGLAFLPFSATMGLVSIAAERLPDGLDLRVPIVVGALAAAGGLWLLGNLGPGGHYGGEVLPPLVLAAAGIALAFVPLMHIATGGAEERDGGLASGMMTACQQIGGAVGIAVAISIATGRTDDALAGGARPVAALTHGFQGAFHVQAALMLAAAVLTAALLGAGRRGASVVTDRIERFTRGTEHPGAGGLSEPAAASNRR